MQDLKFKINRAKFSSTGTAVLENKAILEDMLQAKHKKRVKIIHSPSKSIRPIFNLCKLNAMQVIKNHISKEDKYIFAFNHFSYI